MQPVENHQVQGDAHEVVPARGDASAGAVDPGILCTSVAIGLAVAALVGFLNARLNPPSYRPPQLTVGAPPAAVAPVAPRRPEAETPEGATVPGTVSRQATPLAPRRYEEEPTAHELAETAVEVEPVYVPPVEVEPVGIVARLRQALGKSRAVLQERFDRLFGRPVDESLFEGLEEALLTADVGVPTTDRIVGRVREQAKSGDADPEALRGAMRDEMRTILGALDPSLEQPETRPWVILVVGVNGSGKTTTIGKLAARFQKEGRRVMLAAADTYRAAAGEQLKIWAERAGCDIVAMDEGADPGAVVYDALSSALSRGHDVVIIDTAGRLQTRKPLMEQLGKIRRVIGKQVSDGPHETLLVLDGTMGQNGLSQAQLFHEATPLTGVVVTKLDGTAKGGMVLTIASEMELPVKLIGIGEGVEDLRDFEPDAFVEALA